MAPLRIMAEANSDSPILLIFPTIAISTPEAVRLGFKIGIAYHHATGMSESITDTFGRRLRDLRISVTDRCNFRCRYCMPREKFAEDFEFLRREMLLSFEEINRCVAALLPLGVEKVRITGGEPLLRRDLANLVAMLSAYGIDMALTTNGALLSKYALVLSKAGLNRVTVSLDALDDETFRGMNDMNDKKMSLQQILNGIESATDAGLEVKINCVVRAGVNEHVILQLVEYFRHTPHVLRFIEFMDVGMTNEWRWDEVVTSERILSIIGEVYPLNPIKRSYPGEVAERYLFADGGGEIGIISSVSKPFCGDCSRARISADGKIYTCLFAAEGHDLREVIRGGASDEEVREFMRNIWHHRDDRYSELRSATTTTAEKIEMSYIGG